MRSHAAGWWLQQAGQRGLLEEQDLTQDLNGKNTNLHTTEGELVLDDVTKPEGVNKLCVFRPERRFQAWRIEERETWCSLSSREGPPSCKRLGSQGKELDYFLGVTRSLGECRQ